MLFPDTEKIYYNKQILFNQSAMYQISREAPQDAKQINRRIQIVIGKIIQDYLITKKVAVHGVLKYTTKIKSLMKVLSSIKNQ